MLTRTSNSLLTCEKTLTLFDVIVERTGRNCFALTSELKQAGITFVFFEIFFEALQHFRLSGN